MSILNGKYRVKFQEFKGGDWVTISNLFDDVSKASAVAKSLTDDAVYSVRIELVIPKEVK